MVAFTLALENQGKRVEINNMLDRSFFKRIGATGFGVAPTILTINDAATAGGRWKRTKRGVRDIDIPLTLLSDSSIVLRSMIDLLLDVLDDTYETAKLVAEFGDEDWEIEVHYAAGLDAAHGEDTDGRTFADFVLTLRAPDPYWVSRKLVPYRLMNSSQSQQRGLILNTSLTKLQVAPSQVIGDFDVENLGNVDAYPVWAITGPGDSFLARRNDGRSFRYKNPILPNETVYFDTQRKKVYNQAGENKWTSLDAAPKLFSIPRGSTRIEIQLVNSTSASIVDMSFRPRREMIV